MFDKNGVARRANGSFVPGQSGNPGGHTPQARLSRQFRGYLEEKGAEVVDADPAGRTRLEILGDQIWEDALAGNQIAQKFLLDRISPTMGPLVPKDAGRDDRVYIIRDFTGGAGRNEDD